MGCTPNASTLEGLNLCKGANVGSTKHSLREDLLSAKKFLCRFFVVFFLIGGIKNNWDESPGWRSQAKTFVIPKNHKSPSIQCTGFAAICSFGRFLDVF